MSKRDQKAVNQMARRDFLRLCAIYGTTAALGGVLATAATAGEKELKQQISIQADQEAKKASAAKYTMILAVDGVSNRWPDGVVCTSTMWNVGAWKLKTNIENQSKGAIYVKIVEGGALGGQVKAARKVQQGILQACTASTQNMAAFAPVWNVTDIPYAIGPVENYWKLLYSKEVNDTLRAKSMKQGVMNLATFPQTRWLELSAGVSEEIRLPSQIEGMKIRVTGSKLEQAIFDILPSSPTPIAWGEVYTAMKEGAIDGIHVGPASVADAGIHEVVGQLVNTEFMYNADTIWMNTRWYQKLSPELQEAILEASYQTQLFIEGIYEPLHAMQAGLRPNSPSDAIWRKAASRQILLTDEERAAWQDYLSYEKNKDRFDPMVKKFGKEEFEVVKRVAQSGDTERKRWWKS